MTAAFRDFLIRFGAGLAASGVMAFFGAFLGMYLINAQQNAAIVNVEHEIQRHDKRIEQLERSAETQGKEIAKLSTIPPMVDEIRGDVKKLLQRSGGGIQPSNLNIYSLPRSIDGQQ